MRPQVAERGKADFSFNAVAYIAIGGEPEFAEAVAHHHRYYPVLPVPVEQAIHHGPIGKIKDVVAEYATSGLDLLLLMPEVRSLRQLELLSEQVLPEYWWMGMSLTAGGAIPSLDGDPPAAAPIGRAGFVSTLPGTIPWGSTLRSVSGAAARLGFIAQREIDGQVQS